MTVSKRGYIKSAMRWEHIVGYSRAVRVGDHVSVSGSAAVGDALPATSMVEVTQLIVRRMRVEIEASAIVDD